MNTALHQKPVLSDILNNAALSSLDNLAWRNLQLDSRLIEAGDIFVALPGEQNNGASFIDESIAKGAVAVLVNTEKATSSKASQIDFNGSTPIIHVEALVENLSAIAGRHFSNPSKTLDVIAITGTNGKTTCSVLIAQLLDLLGTSSAMVGTLGYAKLQENQSWFSTHNTTPDAISSQRILRELLDDGASLVAMEVSSHGIEQSRVAAIRFTTAVFTNLSQDHLDYHGTLENYGKSKARLLASNDLRHGVFNYDDAWAQALATSNKAVGLSRVLTYSVTSNKADVYLSGTQFSHEGIRGVLHTPEGSGEFEIKLVGVFNASNALVAVAAALLRGYSLAEILPLLDQLQAPKGRMQLVQISSTQDIQVIVDYAHTPDALEKALLALRLHTKNKLWCVFGCGGNRDKEKRVLMGVIAEKFSDCTVVTNDNPRHEDPADIICDIQRGMSNAASCSVIAERDQAIEFAIQQASSGDTVLIAGKGHEEYQIFADRKQYFSDCAEATAALRMRAEKLCATGGAL